MVNWLQTVVFLDWLWSRGYVCSSKRGVFFVSRQSAVPVAAFLISGLFYTKGNLSVGAKAIA